MTDSFEVDEETRIMMQRIVQTSDDIDKDTPFSETFKKLARYYLIGTGGTLESAEELSEKKQNKVEEKQQELLDNILDSPTKESEDELESSKDENLSEKEKMQKRMREHIFR